MNVSAEVASAPKVPPASSNTKSQVTKTATNQSQRAGHGHKPAGHSATSGPRGGRTLQRTLQKKLSKANVLSRQETLESTQKTKKDDAKLNAVIEHREKPAVDEISKRDSTTSERYAINVSTYTYMYNRLGYSFNLLWRLRFVIQEATSNQME